MRTMNHLHWYLTSRCNLNCSYCFKPRLSADCEPSKEKVETLASMLVDNGVRRVTIGGGEPELIEFIDFALRILKQGGVYVSLHTNGTTLSEERVKQLKGFVGDIAIPIDTCNRNVQRTLRKTDFLPVFERAFGALNAQGVKTGLHTVATALNIVHFPKTYAYVKGRGDFDYWRVYEFKEDFVTDRPKDASRFREIEALRGGCSHEKGGIDSLPAKFLLMEEQMQKTKDRRLQFIGKKDMVDSYVFLDSSGDVRYCPWFSGKRTFAGNLLKEGFKRVGAKLKAADEEGVFFDEEDFIDSMQNRPLWARLWEGNYCIEECEMIKSRYLGEVSHLYRLHRKRTRKQEAA